MGANSFSRFRMSAQYKQLLVSLKHNGSPGAIAAAVVAAGGGDGPEAHALMDSPMSNHGVSELSEVMRSVAGDGGGLSIMSLPPTAGGGNGTPIMGGTPQLGALSIAVANGLGSPGRHSMMIRGGGLGSPPPLGLGSPLGGGVDLKSALARSPGGTTMIASRTRAYSAPEFVDVSRYHAAMSQHVAQQQTIAQMLAATSPTASASASSSGSTTVPTVVAASPSNTTILSILTPTTTTATTSSVLASSTPTTVTPIPLTAMTISTNNNPSNNNTNTSTSPLPRDSSHSQSNSPGSGRGSGPRIAAWVDTTTNGSNGGITIHVAPATPSPPQNGSGNGSKFRSSGRVPQTFVNTHSPPH
jgi:hypothetical protein